MNKDIETIMNEVRQYYKVALEDIPSKRRKREIITVRHIVVYFLCTSDHFHLDKMEVACECGMKLRNVYAIIRKMRNVCRFNSDENTVYKEIIHKFNQGLL